VSFVVRNSVEMKGSYFWTGPKAVAILGYARELASAWMLNALKGLNIIAQGQRQRHPGMESPTPFSHTLKGFDRAVSVQLYAHSNQAIF
jgi:hypothetical protein